MKPDIEPRWTRRALLAGRDPFVQAAEAKLKELGRTFGTTRAASSTSH